MTIDALAAAGKLYIDSNIFIYLVEGRGPLQGLAERSMAFAVEKNIPLVSSELALAECLYGVFKTGRLQLERTYRRLLSADGPIELAPVALPILNLGARMGGKAGLKLVDSIHVATAVETGCDTFLTNDRHFRDSALLRVVQLSETG